MKPNTARPSRSIWNAVSRETHEADVARLLTRAKVPQLPKVYEPKYWLHPNNGSLNQRLPLDVERDVSDGLAFVAAHEDGVGTVTVVTTEVHEQHVTFRIAMNEGLTAEASDAMLKITSAFERCARRGMDPQHFDSQS